MADFIETLLEGLFEVAANWLIALYKMEDAVEFISSIIGLSCIILGTIGAWRGWWWKPASHRNAHESNRIGDPQSGWQVAP